LRSGLGSLKRERSGDTALAVLVATRRSRRPGACNRLVGLAARRFEGLLRSALLFILVALLLAAEVLDQRFGDSRQSE